MSTGKVGKRCIMYTILTLFFLIYLDLTCKHEYHQNFKIRFAYNGIDKKILMVLINSQVDLLFFLYSRIFFILDLGLQEHRLDGEEYLSVIDEFMEAVFTRWPNVIVQVSINYYFKFFCYFFPEKFVTYVFY